MIQRIKDIQTLPDYILSIHFDDGRQVLYDMKEDMGLPGYDQLKTVTGLFDQVQLDASRTCIYWNDEIDLPGDILYEYGKQIS